MFFVEQTSDLLVVKKRNMEYGLTADTVGSFARSVLKLLSSFYSTLGMSVLTLLSSFYSTSVGGRSRGWISTCSSRDYSIEWSVNYNLKKLLPQKFRIKVTSTPHYYILL